MNRRHLGPYFVFVPIVIVQICINPPLDLRSVSFLGFGIIFWTFLEYFLHRFSFHGISILKIFSNGEHLIHHNKPSDLYFLVPNVAPAVVAYLIFCIFLSLILDLMLSASFQIGFAVGYIWYEWNHYSAHHRKPITKYGKYIKNYHMRHHHLDSTKSFGVTNPFWDFVFGT